MSVSHRRSSVALSIIVLWLAVLGLGSSVGAADSPEAAASELLDAVGAGDLTRADTLVCEAERGAVRAMFDIGAQLGLDAEDASSRP